MISRIKLINFQRHTKRVIDLDPLVTTIVGDNDKGKTSIYRALYWLCMARPLGDEFITHDAEKCIVQVWVDDEVVSRMRTASGKSKYRIGDKEFKAVGTNVPQEVVKLLNLDEVNFQNQLDPPFWFLETAGQVSKNLNAIINLDEIDIVLASSASLVRTHRSQVSTAEETITSLEQRIESLFWVTEFSNDVDHLERLEEAHQKTALRRKELLSLAREGLSTKNTLDSLSQAVKEGSKVQALASDLWETKKQRISLEQLLHTARTQQALASQPTRSLDELEESVGEVEEAGLELNTAHKRRVDLQRLVWAAKEQTTEVEEANSNLTDTERELEEKSEGRCPLCGQETKLSSGSVVPTSTCHPTPRSPGPRNRTGSKR